MGNEEAHEWFAWQKKAAEALRDALKYVRPDRQDGRQSPFFQALLPCLLQEFGRALMETDRRAREETLEKIRRELQECPGPEIE
jgi:hypothetical protein